MKLSGVFASFASFASANHEPRSILENPVDASHKIPTSYESAVMGRRILALSRSGPIAAITTGPAFLPGSGPVPAPNAPDGELDEWMLRVATDAQHICGTARMGTDDDSVVDPACRVHGVDRLRVVDASVLRHVPRANTHLAVLAVAERAADIVRGRGSQT